MNDPLKKARKKAQLQIWLAAFCIMPWRQSRFLNEQLNFLQELDTEEDILKHGKETLEYVLLNFKQGIQAIPLDLFVLAAGWINRMDVQLARKSFLHKTGAVLLYLFLMFLPVSNLMAVVFQLIFLPFYLLGDTNWQVFFNNLTENTLRYTWMMCLFMVHAQILKVQQEEPTLFRLMDRIFPDRSPFGKSRFNQLLVLLTYTGLQASRFLFRVLTQDKSEAVIERIRQQYQR